MSRRRIDYDCWYPEVPAVMDTKQLAELLHTNEQIIRAGSAKPSFPHTVNLADASSPSSGTRYSLVDL